MSWKLVGLSFFYIAESEECKVWTGGYCDYGIFGCPQGTQCKAVANHKQCGCFGTNDKGEQTQGCWKGTSATEGQCVNMKVAAQFSDSECLTAYTDRCYDLPPYSLSEVHQKCCGKCGDGTAEPVCHWTYTETKPALELSGSFSLTNDACRDACDALHTEINKRDFYCSDRVNACAEAKQSVFDAIRRTPGVNSVEDFCNSAGQSEIECAWQHKRGKTEDKDCGDRVFDTIQSTFRYKTNDNECKSACEALGAMTKTPADFCNIESIVKKCEAASNSVKNVPEDWCQDKFSGSVPSPAPTDDKLCHDAYRAGCWATGAFKSCCGKCTKDEGEMTCHWSFTGPPNLLGDAHICGQEISGEFAIDSLACFDACNYLSHDVTATKDLCRNTLDKTVMMCDAARKSVSTAMAKTSWCPAEKDMLDLESTMLAAGYNCQAAYEQRCFEKEPFKQCCAECSSGSETHTCHWKFDETNPQFSLEGHFVGAGVCDQVCQALNAGSSQKGAFARLDYCPGGSLYKEAEKCEGAKASLEAVFTPDVCKQEDTATAQCDWTYSYETYDANSGSLNGTIKGSFKYKPSENCADACAALGYYNNMPADYCEGTQVWKTVEKCSEAAATLEDIKKKNLHSAWCSSVKFSQDNAIDYKKNKPDISSASIDQLNQCSESYNQKCFNASLGQKSVGRRAFDQCCGSCFMAVARTTCHWNVEDAGMGPTQGKFSYYGSECFVVCNSINDVKQVSDLCSKDKMEKMKSKCPYAVEVEEVIHDTSNGPSWCP